MPVSGGGIIETEGNYAFLGAMLNGMVILDISDKFNISFVSRFMPDITAVIYKPTKKKDLQPDHTYYFEYYFLCPKCKTAYLVEEAKRFV